MEPGSKRHARDGDTSDAVSSKRIRTGDGDLGSLSEESLRGFSEEPPRSPSEESFRGFSEEPSGSPSEESFRGFSEEPSGDSMLLRLPTEIRYEIFKQTIIPLIEARDINGVVENIENWSLAGAILFDDATQNINTAIIGKIKTTIADNNSTFEGFTFHDSDIYQNRLRLGMDIDTAPFLSKERRSAVVQEALHSGRDSEWLLEKAAANLEYFSDRDRSAIVRRVVQGLQEEKQQGMGGRGWHATLKKLIQKAEHLTPDDRASLVEESCTHGTSDSYLASAWAPVMHKLEESDQRRILTFVAADHYVDGGFSLEHLAEHADKLHPGLRDELAEHVMALSADRQGSSGAICNLAKHLDLFGEEKRAEIVAIVLDNLDASRHEAQNGSRPAWHQAPQFQAVEALHHLHKHQDLAGPKWDDVHEKVAAIIGGSDIGPKTQLIAWMSEGQRTEHARQVLADARNRRPTPGLLALTTRVDSLSPALRSEYLDVLRVKPIGREREMPMTRYNIRNNIGKFSAEERSVLVKRQLRVAVEFQEQAGDIFADLAKISPHLRGSDIGPIVQNAHDIAARQAYHKSYSEMGLSLRACYGEAVRCLGNWSVQRIQDARDPTQLFVKERAAWRAELKVPRGSKRAPAGSREQIKSR